MLFNEFGDKNKPAVLLMHGMMQHWSSVYEPFKALEGDFRLIVPAMDGFYDGSADFTTFEDQARQIEEYVNENCGGVLRGVYGVSQGAMLMTELLTRNNIRVKKAVLDGNYTAHQGNLSAFAMLKLFTKMQKNGGVPPRFMAIAMKLMGLSEKEYAYISKALYWKASYNSMKRNFYQNYNYRVRPELSESRTKVYMICGEKEPYALKTHKILKKYLRFYKEKVYKNLGHGQMLMYHSDILCERLRGFFGK